MSPQNPTPTLASELDELISLDDIRRRARRLRVATIRGLAAQPYPVPIVQDGADAVRGVRRGPNPTDSREWEYDRDDPTDIVELALVLSAERVASKRGVAFEDADERKRFADLMEEAFGASDLKARSEGFAKLLAEAPKKSKLPVRTVPETQTNLGRVSLDSLRPSWSYRDCAPEPAVGSIVLDKIPTMRYARILHELVARPGYAFDIRVPLSYYGLVRELYTPGHPDWVIGSARASQDSSATTFITNECARAILSLQASLGMTALFCEAVATFQSARARVSNVRRVAESPASPLHEWARIEADRAATAFVVTLNSLLRRILFTLPFDADSDEPSYQPTTYEEVVDFIDALPASMQIQVNVSCKNIELALKTIESWRSEEKAAADNEKDLRGRETADGSVPTNNSNEGTSRKAQQFALSATAHEMAKLSLESGRDDLGRIADLLGRKMEPEHWETLAKKLRSAARRIGRTLRPVEKFAGAVLDHELARAHREVPSCDATEAIFAATAFGAITGRWNDPRMAQLVTIVERELEDDGKLPPGKPFQMHDHGYTLHAAHSEITRAFARLVQMSEGSLSVASVEKLLCYYEHNAIRMKSDGSRIGFSANRYSKPSVVSWWASALALNALDRIVRMLNAIIRRRVLVHFSPSRTGGLRLGHLVSTDVGLSASLDAGAGASPRGVRPGATSSPARAPLALQVERMRTHLVDSRLPRLASWPKEVQDPIWSAVLYGPPGTGKTTLFEALANSCGPNCTLVTVTPSDIVMDGLENVELRAKHVMKALSLLTDAVILFDEFDEFIRRRSFEEQAKRDVFSFITPGMLTKFRELHKASEENRVVYALATNMVGNLDDAAIRDGRFDLKIGVYPPDVLSRWGVLVAHLEWARENWKPIEEAPTLHPWRLQDIVLRTGYGPMNTLGRPGWLGWPDKSACRSGARRRGTPFDSLCDPKVAVPMAPPREYDETWGTPQRCGVLSEEDFKETRRPVVREFIEMVRIDQGERMLKDSRNHEGALEKAVRALDLNRAIVAASKAAGRKPATAQSGNGKPKIPKVARPVRRTKRTARA